MREIKFRAWDKKNKKMYDSYIVDDDGEFCVDADYTNECETKPNMDLIQMQFTGLKDNTKWEQLKLKDQNEWCASGKTKEQWNGKEIYEGDIANVYFQMNPSDKIEEYLEIIEDIRRIPRIGGSSRECEIIGNIYENPELLKLK